MDFIAQLNDMITLDRPRDRDTHSIADYAELLCLLNPDRICSRETIADQMHDVGDTRITDVELDDCFNQIDWRISAFGESYPFVIDENGRNFSALEELTPKQEFYVLLLLSSNLPYLEIVTNPLTEAFERISFLALTQASPSMASVRPFGKNETDYTGPKWQRINALAEQIGGHGRCNENTFRTRDSGDGGIDLASWLTLDIYERRNIPSSLAQCACSREAWSSKQTEISHARLGGQIQPTHLWSQILFIPHCFRDNVGNWAFEGEVGLTIIYDRLRIVKILENNIDWLYINPPQALQDFLETRLDLV